MKYKVLSQSPVDERMFTLKRMSDERIFYVDIYTDGGLELPKEYTNEKDGEKANIIFNKWLGSFVGEILEIEDITPLYYSTTGKIKLINSTKKNEHLNQ